MTFPISSHYQQANFARTREISTAGATRQPGNPKPFFGGFGAEQVDTFVSRPLSPAESKDKGHASNILGGLFF